MITDEQIIRVIELTATIFEDEMVWGDGTEIAHIDELIKNVREILEPKKSKK